jgi:type IV pilus assembly protein PilB
LVIDVWNLNIVCILYLVSCFLVISPAIQYANMPDQTKIAEILTSQGLVTPEQLKAAQDQVQASGQTLVEALTKQGAAPEAAMTQALSAALGLAFVDLAGMPPEPAAIALLPDELCRSLKVMPLFVNQDTLTLAVSKPLEPEEVKEVETASKSRVKQVFACPSAIRAALVQFYHLDLTDSAPQETEEQEDKVSLGYVQPPEGSSAVLGGSSDDQIASLKQAASLTSVVNLVDSIVAKGVQSGASDIHLEPERDSFNCRYRVDGVLFPASKIAQSDQAAVISRIKIMANLDIAEKRLPQDGRIQTFAAGREIDLRVSTFPSIYGENIVMRILDRSGGILTLKQLGFEGEVLKIFSGLIRRPYGIILVTGPTGSGKTTTLYAVLSEINSQDKNIITLEDPVEYEIPNVRQSQVNVKAGLTFATGLRSIVRQDPDIIMIGEIRDKETAEIAIHAALTGHLVFSTLHTNDAPSAATRMIDMGVEPFLIASSVIGVLSQRLVRLLCPACKKKVTMAADSAVGAKDFSPLLQKLMKSKRTFYQETGCKKCNQRGFLGRAGIFELFVPDDPLKELITQKASAAVLRERAIKSGMRTLSDDGFLKVTSGLTSLSELLRVTETT